MIGIFDSGYGGLTILRAVVDQLPQYSYIYYGDNAHAPYGSRSQEEIYNLTLKGVEYLFAQGCELIILGCNTVSAAALRRIQQEILPQRYPNQRVLGIVVPTIEQVTGTSWEQKNAITTPLSDDRFTVGIIGTTATIKSGVYEQEIHKRNPSIEVVEQDCPSLAPLVEESAAEEKIQKEVGKCIGALIDATENRLDAVLLGCTHYELITDQIKSALPSNVKVYEQPAIVAESLKEYLHRHPEIEQKLKREEQRQFVTTGDAETVSPAASRYFGEPVEFKGI